LLNEDKKTVTLAAETGGDVPTSDTTLIMPLSNLRGAREVINTGRPAVINDCTTDPRWRASTETNNIRAWLGVPLRVRNEAVGVLNINSHIINRFLPDDIDFAEAFADQAGVAIQNARAHELEIKVYETELETARAIQNSLLPQEPPPVPQLEIAAYNIAARHVSGDYYQYFPLPDGKLGVAIGDVSGKGIPAALLMAVVTTTLRDEILTTQAPSTLLNELNSRLLPRMKQNNMNSALLVSMFDPATRHVEIANAGMVQPYVRNGKGWDSVPVGGYPLGASARMSYNAKVVTLAPDSILLLISDGVIESQNLKGEFFGFEGLEALLAEMPLQISAQQLVENILDAVRTHLEGQEPQDDITVVVMKSVDMQ
jgi:serine phosphatase RsbU (regulator of sigma subunit)